MTDLTELEGLLKEATPRPWEYRPDAEGTEGNPCFRGTRDGQLEPVICEGPWWTGADGELIVAAVNALPALIERLKDDGTALELAYADRDNWMNEAHRYKAERDELREAWNNARQAALRAEARCERLGAAPRTRR